MIEREDQHALSAIVGSAGLLLAPADRLAYETAARYGGGSAAAVVRPADATQVSAVVRYLVTRGIPFTPQSGNTGGARFLRYGDMRRQVLGLDVVLPDEAGTVLKLSSGLRKDNAHLDLRQVFIGSCGAFGIITAATLTSPRRPRRAKVSRRWTACLRPW